MTGSSTSPTADDLALLAARKTELARPLDEQQDDLLDLLVVTVAEHTVAIPVTSVREVRPPGHLAQAPRSNGVLAGVVGGHGDALAVASLAALLGFSTAVPVAEQWVAVLDHPIAALGLLVDEAVDIVNVRSAELSAPSDTRSLVAAVVPDGALVLDIVALMDDPRLFLSSPDPIEELSWPET